MRTPNVIKKALNMCASTSFCPQECPYYDDCMAGRESIMIDALFLIESLEGEYRNTPHWTECTECSECGEMALYNGNEEPVRSKFCPHCGAKMDGGVGG